MCLAVPGRVIEVGGDEPLLMGRVDFGGAVREVSMAYVPDIAVGDYAIVHVGFAIQRLDEESARRTLQALAQTGLLDEEIPPAP